MKQLQPDAVVEISLPSAISIVQAMRQQGYKAKVTLVSAGYDPSVFTAGIGGPGVYAQLANIPYLGAITALPNAAQDFRNAMAKYAPNTTISNNAVLGWAGTVLLVHGLQLAGKCPTQAEVTSKLRALGAARSRRDDGAKYPVLAGRHTGRDTAGLLLLPAINSELVQCSKDRCVSVTRRGYPLVGRPVLFR